jgi:hypothetical protein
MTNCQITNRVLTWFGAIVWFLLVSYMVIKC